MYLLFTSGQDNSVSSKHYGASLFIIEYSASSVLRREPELQFPLLFARIPQF
jgi:hypothetical protein